MNPRIVALCGGNLVVSALGASLRRSPEIQIRDFEEDFSRIEMNIKADPPAAILFDLATTPVNLVLSVFRAYPKVMLIKVDLASKKQPASEGLKHRNPGACRLFPIKEEIKMEKNRETTMEKSQKCSLTIVLVTVAVFLFGLFGGFAFNPANAAVIHFDEFQITSTSAAQENPDIDGYNIVYQDYRNGNYDIYVYTVQGAVEPEARITTDTANQINPRISGDKIVYQDDRNGNWDIYMTMVSYLPGSPPPGSEPPATTPEAAIQQIVNIQDILLNPDLIPTDDISGANKKVKENRINALLNKLDAVIASIQVGAGSTTRRT